MKNLLVGAVCFGLVGCVGLAVDSAVDDAEIVAEDGLGSGLLYDLLLADIARQRGQTKIALEALVRAGVRSRDRRVLAQGIELAARLDAYESVISLADLLTEIQGDTPLHPRLRLLLAEAELAVGEDELALAGLLDLARRQAPGDESVLRSIVALLAARPRDENHLARFRDAAESPPNASLKLTAALLAEAQNDAAGFRELLDEALALRADWGFAAMYKLSDLAAHNPPKMSPYAEEFLRQSPDATAFRVHYGRLLLRADLSAEAIAEFDVVLAKNARHFDALQASGVAFMERENRREALARLTRALAVQPQNAQVRLSLADLYLADSDDDSAAEMLYEITAPGYYLEVETRLAMVVARRDGLDAGLQYLAEIDAQNDAEMVRVILARDLLFREFDDLESAKNALDDGLARLPGNTDLLYNRGLLAARMGLLEIHERDLREIIAAEPENAHAYNALGYTLADQTARIDEALALIRRALELRPNDAYILDSMGWARFRMGDYAAALDYLRRAISAKQNAEIAAHLGEVLWVTGAQKEAREIWEMGVEWDADNAVLLETMARFLAAESAGLPVRLPSSSLLSPASPAKVPALPSGLPAVPLLSPVLPARVPALPSGSPVVSLLPAGLPSPAVGDLVVIGVSI